MKYSDSTIPVCSNCTGNSNAPLAHCNKCGVEYCNHFASPTDTQFCGNCLGDFYITESIEVKTTTHTNAEGAVTYIKRQAARNIKLEGTDWLFNAEKIPTLSDEELIASIEYHNAIKGMMLLEREERKVERLKKLSAIRIITPSNRKVKEQAELDAERAGLPIAKKRRSTIVKSAPVEATPEAAMELLKKLQKAGFDMATLSKLVGGK